MTEHHEKAYERIVHRVEESLGKAEKVTLEELKHGIDQAIEFEEDVEELTKQEVSLLGAYLKRDLKNLNRFMGQTGKGLADWLKFDMGLLENKLQSMLKQVADKSIIEQHQLEEELAEHDEEVYVSNEYVLAGTFVCNNCETEQEFIKPGFLMSCAECGGDQFQRTSHE
jgi:Zinc-ribbon containing domain